ncbi:hypothetical protein F5X96DRAFT_666058 [Biscogniauxia mediterranea]|nr:hypothetical protein F5X96DRAFT_666058 [Biscogniauxia mediterranea]
MKTLNPIAPFLFLLATTTTVARLPPGTKLTPPPGIVQPGAPVETCYAWVEAGEGQSCAEICGYTDLTVQQFLEWNPQMGGDCAHNLWAGYFYCWLQDNYPDGRPKQKLKDPLGASPMDD